MKSSGQVVVEEFVQPGDDLPGTVGGVYLGAKDRARFHHDQGGPHVVPRDVGNGDVHHLVAAAEKVVVVTPHVSGRYAAAGQFDAGHARHLDVEQHDVGLGHIDLGQRVGCIARLAHDLVRKLRCKVCQQFAHARACHRLVVNDQDRSYF